MNVREQTFRHKATTFETNKNKTFHRTTHSKFTGHCDRMMNGAFFFCFSFFCFFFFLHSSKTPCHEYAIVPQQRGSKLWPMNNREHARNNYLCMFASDVPLQFYKVAVMMVSALWDSALILFHFSAKTNLHVVEKLFIISARIMCSNQNVGQFCWIHCVLFRLCQSCSLTCRVSDPLLAGGELIWVAFCCKFPDGCCAGLHWETEPGNVRTPNAWTPCVLCNCGRTETLPHRECILSSPRSQPSDYLK